MKERIEIMGDAFAEYQDFLEKEAREREEAWTDAPELPDWTDEELDAFAKETF